MAREWVIGRADGCDIRPLNDDYVSTKHARIWEEPPGFVWIEDLGSTNGTFVNGVRVFQKTRLLPGCVVKIGRTEIPWRVR